MTHVFVSVVARMRRPDRTTLRRKGWRTPSNARSLRRIPEPFRAAEGLFPFHDRARRAVTTPSPTTPWCAAKPASPEPVRHIRSPVGIDSVEEEDDLL